MRHFIKSTHRQRRSAEREGNLKFKQKTMKYSAVSLLLFRSDEGRTLERDV